MPDEPPQTPDDTGNVLVFRNPAGQPVSVPANVVAVAQVVYQAYMAKIAGMDWPTIAAQFSYPTAAAARADVERYIQEGAALVTDQSRQAVLEMEVHRLDVLQMALWENAMKGSIPAVSEVRQIIKTRADLVRDMADKVADGTRTVVIPVGPQEYTRMLQEIAERDEAASASSLPDSDDDDG